MLIGGDLNMNYRSAKEYLPTEMAAAGLTPTFAITGSAPPTGIHYGATIDYILLRSANQFTVQRQWTTSMQSDHLLLGADVALLGNVASYFSPGKVANDPASTGRVTTLVRQVLVKAPKGANVRILSRSMDGGGIVTSIRQARARGVNVKVIVGNAKPSAADRKLAKLLGTKAKGGSYFMVRPSYWKKRTNLPKAVVTASASGGTVALRVDLNRPILKASQSKRMVAVLAVEKAQYDWFFTRFETIRRR